MGFSKREKESKRKLDSKIGTYRMSEREGEGTLTHTHTHTHTHRVTAKVTSRTLIDEAYERSRESNRNSCMYVYLHKHPSVNHTNPHPSFLLCEALTHTLSLLASLAVTSAPC